jgi:hypothetical protein
MVSECANPKCGARFLYFGEGKLPAAPRPVNSSSRSHMKLFWLCGECATHLSMHVTPQGEISVVPKATKAIGHTA